MKLPRWAQFFLYSVVLIVPAVFMTWKILAESSFKCEVCMDYKGASKCREATGPDKDSCQRTAADNACAFIASGMTESIACTSTPPTSVKFF